MDSAALHTKVRISGTLVFKTAFHIGSGREGELATDMGVLRDVDGTPLLPGATLKGSFRSLAERIGCHLGLSACLLDSTLSGVPCVTDEKYRKSVKAEFDRIGGEQDKVFWLDGHTCDICRLFGSPMRASRIFFSDGIPMGSETIVAVRDGVSLDRDSGTARHGVKYDFEVVPAGAAFSIVVDLENPVPVELALVAAVLSEWENGVRLGGFTSRGLGMACLKEKRVEQVDYYDRKQLQDFLLNRKMTPASGLLDDALKAALGRVGDGNA